MRIKILGTAAAEGWPALFCSCETCRKARQLGGKNIRSRAAIQFGEKHRIDFGPDAWYHEAILNVDISKLEHLFITHSHEDHFYHQQLHYLIPPFGHGRTGALHVYGNEKVISTLKEHWGRLEGETIILHKIEPFVPIQAGNMIFTPLRAIHMQGGEIPLNYIASDGSKTILYNCDTGQYEDDTWDYLGSTKIDCVISECTCGPLPGGGGHMNFETVLTLKERLEKFGSYTTGPFIVTHFSHNIGMMHDEIEELLKPHGIIVAYDGMEVVI